MSIMHGAIIDPVFSVIPGSFRDPAFILSAKQWIPANKNAGKTIGGGLSFSSSLSEASISTSVLSSTATGQ